MSSVPLIIGWKLNKRGPTIPLTRRYQVVEIEGLADGDSVKIWGIVHDGEYLLTEIMSNGVWEIVQGSAKYVQAELCNRTNKSEVFVWVK